MLIYVKNLLSTADNTAYTLRLRLALRDIALFDCNVVYAENVREEKCGVCYFIIIFNMVKLFYVQFIKS
jgi:hypothetical protein